MVYWAIGGRILYLPEAHRRGFDPGIEELEAGWITPE